MCPRKKLDQIQITVSINKVESTLPEGIKVQTLLEQRGAKTRSAVWINGKQLLMAEYPTWVIREGDEIKILRVVAGG